MLATAKDYKKRWWWSIIQNNYKCEEKLWKIILLWVNISPSYLLHLLLSHIMFVKHMS